MGVQCRTEREIKNADPLKEAKREKDEESIMAVIGTISKKNLYEPTSFLKTQTRKKNKS